MLEGSLLGIPTPVLLGFFHVRTDLHESLGFRFLKHWVKDGWWSLLNEGKAAVNLLEFHSVTFFGLGFLHRDFIALGL
jgi:hypothetical protein